MYHFFEKSCVFDSPPGITDKIKGTLKNIGGVISFDFW